MLRCLTRHARRFTVRFYYDKSLVTGDVFRGTTIRRFSSNTHVNLYCTAAVNCIYPERPLSFNSKQEGSNTFEPLAVTALKRFEPFTPAAVLLVQRISGNEKATLKLADRRLGHRGW